MEERGRQVDMPRGALPKEAPSTFAVVFWVSFALSTVLAVGQIGFVLSVAPIAMRVVSHLGGTPSPAYILAANLGPLGIAVVLGVLNVLIFALFAWLAKRYWIGLLFVPSIMFLAGGFAMFWIFATPIIFVG